MTTVNFPIHFKLSYLLAIHAFAKDGFLYDSQIIAENEDSFSIGINASEQEIIELGIRIGYRLNGEAKDIETQYNKWLEISDKTRNEFDQRKEDKQFRKLEKMFPTKTMFSEYWKGKCSNKLIVK